MSIDYDKIRAENIREYGEGTRHLAFLGRLYTDRTHFIFELLQNAEDAKATRIHFELFADRLEVRHDGRLFDEHDVKGICGVGDGTKAKDLTQIGRFGIGFKSVYAYTTSPEIYSGEENFKIEHYVRPYKIPTNPRTTPLTTLFIFPFNVEEVKQEAACDEIGRCLHGLSVRTLLFLQNIKEIEYDLPYSRKGIYLREERLYGSGKQVTVIGQSKGKAEEEKWLIFERSIPDTLGNTRIEISFCLDLEEITEKKKERIRKIQNSPLVVYFPTEKETNLGFLIQGPYRTTPSRDNIPRDDDWNTKLIQETASLLIEALPQIRDLGLLTISFLETLPIRMEDFPEDNMFHPIAKAVIDTLLEEDLLPTDDGLFVSANNAKLARTTALRALFSHEQLCALFESNNPLKWLIDGITYNLTPELRTYLIQNLGIEEVTPESSMQKINNLFLDQQSDEWFIVFYKYLLNVPNLWQDPSLPLCRKPILRLEDGSQATPFKLYSMKPNVFLPPQGSTNFPIVKRAIAGDEKAKDFLRKLGLSEPDTFDDIVKLLQQKYTAPDISLISKSEYLADIRAILEALHGDSESGKEKVKEAARQTPFLKAFNDSGYIAFKKPDEIYQDIPELKIYFKPSNDIWFLHEDCLSTKDAVDVWQEIGVADLPRVMVLKELTNENVPHEEQEYSTLPVCVENYHLDGLEKFLEHISNTLDFIEQKDYALVLWNFLENYLKQNLYSNAFLAKYEWHYYSWHCKRIPSLLFSHLKNTLWVPIKDETLVKPSEITTEQLFDEFLDATQLINKLGINALPEPDTSEEERKHEIATELGISLEHFDIIRELSKDPDMIEQLKAQIAARKEPPTFPISSVFNPERRREKLEEQMSEAPERKYETRERSVRTTRGTVAPGILLKNLYMNESKQLICQICRQEMPFKKPNGEYYFAKREITGLPKEFDVSYVALCPLCAAKYQVFIQSDDEAMSDLKKAILSTQICEVPITLDDNASIRFVEKHIHDLKIILKESL